MEKVDLLPTVGLFAGANNRFQPTIIMQVSHPPVEHNPSSIESNRHMKVAFVPVWDGNPYHPELEKSLNSAGVRIADAHCLKQVYSNHVSGAEKVDVVHLHSLPYFGLSPIEIIRYFLFYSRLKRLKERGVRIVWTVHDFRNHDSPFWRLEDWFGRHLAERLHGLIVHGKSAKQLIDSNWGKLSSEISVIPHGHYIDSYPNDITPAAARASLGLDASNVVFLFLGLIRPYKGVVEMVRAFRGCSDPNARLVIAGRPVDEAIKNEVVHAIDGDPRIKFIPGFVKDEDVQLYMNASDVVVLPYRRILTSGAAILAMSFGKACIAPREGCITDSLDSNGALFFDPAIERDLDRALQVALACRQKLAAMGRHNLDRAADWDWQGIARATLAVYQQSNGADKKQVHATCFTR
jgi:beta-1,4-mannosyltransferase